MKYNSPLFYFVLAVVCFAIAAVSLSGVVMRNDATGQIVFGTVWIMVGLGWVARALRSRRMNRVHIKPPTE